MKTQHPFSLLKSLTASLLLGFLSQVGSPTSSQAVTWRADQTAATHEAIANNSGAFTAGALWPDLTPLGWIWDFDGPGLRGSAALIAPNWVLTAGHVLKLNADASFTLDNMWFFLGPNTGANFAQARVVEAVLFPAWEQNFNLFEGVDLALLRIEANLGSIHKYANLATETPALGTRMVGGGYGIGGTGLTGGNEGLGVKRAMENIVDRNPSNLQVSNSTSVGGLLVMDFDSPTDATVATNTLNQTWGTPFGPGTSSPTSLTYEGSLSPGDSGGAMFYYDGTTWRLAGVNSFISSVGPGGLSAGYGTISSTVNVANQYDWIAQTIAIPEPGTLMLLLMAVVFDLFVRRRIS